MKYKIIAKIEIDVKELPTQGYVFQAIKKAFEAIKGVKDFPDLIVEEE